VNLLHSGKVRDVYADGDDLILVASDRLSIYDVVLPTPVPDKGVLLTQLSLWWFDRLTDITPNHVISASDVPPEFVGRAMRCRRLSMLPVECIARGYLAGLGLQEYQKHGSVSGVALPPGLVEGSKLPEPIFTPTTKAPVGEHDEFMTFEDVVAALGADTAARLRDLTLAVYARGADIAGQNGILVADTKLEFGLDAAGEIVLADEVLTPDSSRFWPADQYSPGKPQPSYDKQFVRDYLEQIGFNKQPPGPALPDDVVRATSAKYVEALTQLTGRPLREA
jgi:phosphoribosylaminoimidazole-succinocarboxamide synthase